MIGVQAIRGRRRREGQCRKTRRKRVIIERERERGVEKMTVGLKKGKWNMKRLQGRSGDRQGKTILK